MANRFYVKLRDVRHKLLNDPIIIDNNSIAVADDKAVFFIGAVFGTSITIKNAVGTTLIDNLGTHHFFHPLRLDEGFTITGTNLTAYYTRITKE